MSSVSHQPRRAGGSTEQRASRESPERMLVRYDSEQAPVLIRLPDISNTRVEAVLAATETHVQAKRSHSKSKSRRQSRESHSTSDSHKPETKNAFPSKKSRMPNKLVVAGIIVGLSLGTLIFLTSGKKTEPAAQEDLWSTNDSVTSTEPDVMLPGDQEQMDVYSQADHDARQGTQVVPPDLPPIQSPTGHLDAPDLVRQPLPDDGNQPLPYQTPAENWPAEALGEPVESWPPTEIDIAGPRGQSQTAPYEDSIEPSAELPNYRSSMRTTADPNSRVLDGTIETPTPRANYERAKTRLY